MRRRDRLQKASIEESGDYWFKSLLGFSGQGILSLGYYLRGIFMGFRCPRPAGLSGEGQGAGFGSEGWPRVWVPFGYEELMWDLRMGGL